MVQGSIAVLWSPAALVDLDRFAEFLFDSHSQLASDIADAILSGADILADLPMLGRPITGKRFRQLVIVVHNASYVLRYRAEGQRVVILRVFHGREQQKP